MSRGSNIICESIADCKTGKYVYLELFIVQQYRNITARICTACDSKNCKPQCGKKLYKDKMMYFFDAIDHTENHINVRNAPWSKANLGSVKTGHFYKIEGKIGTQFYGKWDLVVEKIEEISNFSID